MCVDGVKLVFSVNSLPSYSIPDMYGICAVTVRKSYIAVDLQGAVTVGRPKC
jgi:hypothetical protein